MHDQYNDVIFVIIGINIKSTIELARRQLNGCALTANVLMVFLMVFMDHGFMQYAVQCTKSPLALFLDHFSSSNKYHDE